MCVWMYFVDSEDLSKHKRQPVNGVQLTGAWLLINSQFQFAKAFHTVPRSSLISMKSVHRWWYQFQATIKLPSKVSLSFDGKQRRKWKQRRRAPCVALNIYKAVLHNWCSLISREESRVGKALNLNKAKSIFRKLSSGSKRTYNDVEKYRRMDLNGWSDKGRKK